MTKDTGNRTAKLIIAKRVMICLAVLAAVLCLGAPGFKMKAASFDGVVNTEALNVRTGAGTNYEVLKSGTQNVILLKDAKVKVVEEPASGWYKIEFTYNGTAMTGYVASRYITNQDATTAVTATTAPATTATTSTTTTATTAATATTSIKTTTKSTNILASNIAIPARMVKKQKVKSATLKKNTDVKITAVKKQTGKNKTGKYKFKITFTKKKKTYSAYVDSSLVSIVKGLYPAYVTEKVTVYRKAGVTKSTTKASKKTTKTQSAKLGKLSANKKIKIIKEKTVNNKKWFYIRYKKNKKTTKGWVMEGKIMFTSGKSTDSSSGSKAATPAVALSDAEFEADMKAQGFPESYKAQLRTLHEKHPYWQFKIYKTDLDWQTAVSKESALGKSLVPNTRITAWKSAEAGAYDPVNDKYIVYDGTQWVCASRAAVEYYMDPRNFLDEKAVFMFEALGYEPSYQTTEGVSAILADTLFGGGATYTYTADDGSSVTKTYVDTFMEAATINSISPVHLASRVKQEVVTGKTSVSNSVTGKVAGYEGIYNFYNIGATDSATGQAVINGLKFASTGTTFMRPWNNQYKAIVGGAKYISDNYISRGQNTIYLERFNVTPNNTYDHQYMTNAGAAYSEAIKNYTAYQGVMDKPFVFYIPVYNNMPDSACLMPSGNLSPNNYLKTLTVTGGATGTAYGAATPFAIGSDGSIDYIFTIPATETAVTISAAPINAYATVNITGTAAGTVNGTAGTATTGTVNLDEPSKKVKVKVKAQDGTQRTYTIIINRG